MLREPLMDVVVWLLTCFGVFIPAAMLVQVWSGEKLRTLLHELSDAAIVLIRWAGIACFLLWLVGLCTIDGESAEWMNLVNRMSGPYAAAYWIYLVAYVVVTQLFWIKTIYDSKVARLISAIFILLVVNIERIIIVITSIHRDYVPGTWAESNSYSWMMMISNPIMGLTYSLKITAFVVLLFIIRYRRAKN